MLPPRSSAVVCQGKSTRRMRKQFQVQYQLNNSQRVPSTSENVLAVHLAARELGPRKSVRMNPTESWGPRTILHFRRHKPMGSNINGHEHSVSEWRSSQKSLYEGSYSTVSVPFSYRGRICVCWHVIHWYAALWYQIYMQNIYN